MLSRLTLANAAGEDVVIHEDTASSRRTLVSADGLVGIGELRQSKRFRPSAHGALNETSYEDGRAIHLVGEVWSQVSIEKALEEFRALCLPMLQTLDNGAALMKWTEGTTGLKLQMLVKLDSKIAPILEEAHQFLQYATSFFAEDPRAYTQAQTTQAGSGLSGSAAESTWQAIANRPYQVAVDSGHIYWIDRVTAAIGRAAIGGGTVENEWVKTERVPTALAIDSGHVYWGTSGTSDKVGRAAIGGGTIENSWMLAGTPPNTAIVALAVNASNLFYAWESGSEKSIGRATIAGGSIEKGWMKLEVAATSLALDASFIYFGHSSGIGRATLAGAELKVTWIAGTGSVTGVAVNATNVFWTNSSGRAIGRAKLAGTEVNPAFIIGLESEASGIAINSEHIYWCEHAAFIARSKELANGGPIGSEVKVKQAGNRPTPLIFKIRGLAVNPTIIRNSDGASITLQGTVTAGNFIEINTADRTVLLNGESNLLGFLNAVATDWAAFEAPPNPGEEGYRLGASSATTAVLEVLSRSAYA